MLTAARLQRTFYSLLNLLGDDGIEIEFGYQEKIWKLTIEPTGKAYRYVRPRERRGSYKRGVTFININECKVCKYPTVDGICVNKKCDTNTQPKPNS